MTEKHGTQITIAWADGVHHTFTLMSTRNWDLQLSGLGVRVTGYKPEDVLDVLKTALGLRNDTDEALLTHARLKADEWRKQGFKPAFSPHHFLPPQADFGTKNRRLIVKRLNRLVADGKMRTGYDGRYKVWYLA
jgi:hypothetical protein